MAVEPLGRILERGAEEMARPSAAGVLGALFMLWTLYVFSHGVIPGPPDIPAIGAWLIAELTGLVGALMLAGILLLAKNCRSSWGVGLVLGCGTLGFGLTNLWKIVVFGNRRLLEPIFPAFDPRLVALLVISIGVAALITAVRVPRLLKP